MASGGGAARLESRGLGDFSGGGVAGTAIVLRYRASPTGTSGIPRASSQMNVMGRYALSVRSRVAICKADFAWLATAC